jgi:DNA polymerase III delta subunit
MGVDYFDLASEGALERLISFCRNQSVFEPKKLAVCEGAFEGDAGDFALVLKAIIENRDVTILISEPEKPPKPLVFLGSPPVLSQNFEILKGEEWKKFVSKKASELKVVFSAPALEIFARAYEGDSWALMMDLEKLKCLGREVTEKDLGEFGLEVAPDFWALFGGLRSNRKEERLSMLEKVFSMNEPAPKIFNILASLWKEKASAMAGYDRAVKWGKIEYEEALLDLVLS